ncbi:mitochondrial Carrier (MC) Family [Babesia caballi]|uniref:Mitochondrial Carrier (MC) Family n=1 Tax=Babesia caballi TaxID=5871 RepID=A0AAV4LLS9_BABCB|nr:mitochondrial Carrier (MC) Family [Babesia caballi]
MPYTMAKFYFFEKVVNFYSNVLTKPKEQYSKTTQLSVTFASGYLAGIICAIVSHPADSLISQLGKAENRGKGVLQIASETGYLNLFTRGLATRILMIGTLTGLQWWICDTFKVRCAWKVADGVAQAYKASYLPWLEETRMRNCAEQMSRLNVSGQ